MDPAENALIEGNINHDLLALLSEIDNEKPDVQGILLHKRHLLHKTSGKSFLKNLAVLRTTVTELEIAERTDCRRHLIPLLNILIYALMQSVYVPDELCHRVFQFLKKLMVLPQPFCTLAQTFAPIVKAEHATPGLLYGRMVVAEQNLKSESYTRQEKVFVFADSLLFPEVVSRLLKADIEETPRDPQRIMCGVIQHSLQAALGPGCDGPSLLHALQDLDDHFDVESYFQKVLATLEQFSNEELRVKLRDIYCQILQDAGTGQMCYSEAKNISMVPLPNPEMSFHLWWEEDQLWKELSNYMRSASQSFSAEECEVTDLARYSVISTDSGIERDMHMSENFDVESLKPEKSNERLTRRGGMKVRTSAIDNMDLMQEALEETETCKHTLQRKSGSTIAPLPKQKQDYMAKIVVMGDDRVLGRLARAYYWFRKREARRRFLSIKLNLQMYYIPIHPIKGQTGSLISESFCSLGLYLGLLDSWYDYNICGLGQTIAGFAQMSSLDKQDVCFGDMISYYVRMAQQPVFFNVYSIKICFSNISKEAVEEVFITDVVVDFPEFRKAPAGNKHTVKQRKKPELFGALVSISYLKVLLSSRRAERGFSLRTTTAHISAIPESRSEDLNCLTISFLDADSKSKSEQKVRTSHFKLKTPDKSTFTVCLDKDFRRTFLDVESIEVSPCQDPGYYFNKKSNSIEEEDINTGLSKFMSKGLTLPINTFAGIVD